MTWPCAEKTEGLRSGLEEKQAAAATKQDAVLALQVWESVD